MGKITKGQKPKDIPVKKSAKMTKQRFGKSVPKVSLKRFLMLQRRLNSILAERHLWEEKSKELLESLKAEKMLSASLRKDSFHWQRLYHESTVTVNTHKVKQAEITQEMSACLREMDSAYPHMVAFTDLISNNKVRISNILNSLPSSVAEYEYLPRKFRENDKIIEDTNKSMEKPTKHRVGPMVRGLLITKPKIMLERLMLPQPQDPGPVSMDDVSTVEENNQLTPIQEEDEHEEVISMDHISIRPKRKLGRSTWKLRRQEKINKERERNRENKPPTAVIHDGDSSDTESNSAALNDIEPVVLFNDVSRLLQNSSRLKVDNSRNSDTDVGLDHDQRSDTGTIHLPVSKSRRIDEDPLEGSSWMFNNNHNHLSTYCPPSSCERSSLYKNYSDDDDYDEANILVVPNNIANLSCMDTLVNKNNETFTIASEMNNSAYCVDTSNIVEAPTTAEPDSTNNIDVQHSNNSSVTDLSDNSKTVLLSHKSEADSSNTASASIPVPVVRLSFTNNVQIPTPSKRNSSSCNNHTPTQNLEYLGKRIRKKKNLLYPGEVLNPQFESTSRKSSAGRKTQRKSSSMKIKNRLSSGRSPDPEVPDSCGVANKTKRKTRTSGMITKGNKIPKKSSIEMENTSRMSLLSGTPDKGVGTKASKKKKKQTGSSEKKTIPKKISSIEMEKTSRMSSLSGTPDKDNRDSIDNRPRRRTKSQVNYKEMSVKIKVRRP